MKLRLRATGYGIFGPETDPLLLPILLFFLFGATSLKSYRFRRFKSDRDEIWLDYCSRK